MMPLLSDIFHLCGRRFIWLFLGFYGVGLAPGMAHSSLTTEKHAATANKMLSCFESFI